jgi:hypothetical protein
MIPLHDCEAEHIRGGALINLTLPGIAIPVITGVGTGVSLTTLSEGSSATSTVANNAALTNLLASVGMLSL